MTSPGCTRHVVEMTTEQKYLEHLIYRAATAATYEHRSNPFRDWMEEGVTMNLLRTNAAPAVEAGVARSNGIGNRLGKSVTNPEQNSTKRTLKSVLLASSRTGHGQDAPLERAKPSDGIGDDETVNSGIPEYSRQNYGNVDL